MWLPWQPRARDCREMEERDPRGLGTAALQDSVNIHDRAVHRCCGLARVVCLGSESEPPVPPLPPSWDLWSVRSQPFPAALEGLVVSLLS